MAPLKCGSYAVGDAVIVNVTSKVSAVARRLDIEDEDRAGPLAGSRACTFVICHEWNFSNCPVAMAGFLVILPWYLPAERHHRSHAGACEGSSGLMRAPRPRAGPCGRAREWRSG
jgi:hypothetical protein